MGDLFQSGLVVEAILGFMALELIGLILIRNNGFPLFRPREILFNFGAGAALLMALRSALTTPAWHAVALWLLAALVCHIGDLAMRWSMRRTR